MRFEDFARLHGLLIDIAYPSQKIRRCATAEHPRKKNGSYLYDGRRGWVLCWDGDGELKWWNDPDAKPWTDAEKRAWQQQRAAARAREADKHRRAALAAEQALGDCVLEPHPYLRSKGFADALGLVNEAGELLVPMRHVQSYRIVTLQRILWVPESVDDEGKRVRAHWTKKFFAGGDPKGAVLRLGDARAPETWLCEGYATALSIEAALQSLSLPASVLACFSDHNMVRVAQQLPGRKFVFADHDQSGAGQRAAERIGVPAALSPQLGEDANDLHQRAGLLAVCRQIMAARR